MGLEDILKTIKEKSKKEADELIRQAEKERDALIRKAEQEAGKVKQDYLEEFRKKAEEKKKRKIIRVKGEGKKRILSLKQRILDETFSQAKEELGNLRKEEYLPWLRKVLLSNIDSDCQEIIVSPRDKAWMEGDFPNGVEKESAEWGGKAKLSLRAGLPQEERGFVLKKEGMEINRTFSNLFRSLRDELEIEVAEMLFSQTR